MCHTIPRLPGLALAQARRSAAFAESYITNYWKRTGMNRRLLLHFDSLPAFSQQKKINLTIFTSFHFAAMAETMVRAGEGGGGAVRPELLHRREQEEAEGHHLPR